MLYFYCEVLSHFLTFLFSGVSEYIGGTVLTIPDSMFLRDAVDIMLIDRKEFDLYASMKTAKEVGGDFYDFFFIDDDHM